MNADDIKNAEERVEKMWAVIDAADVLRECMEDALLETTRAGRALTSALVDLCGQHDVRGGAR